MKVDDKSIVINNLETCDNLSFETWLQENVKESPDKELKLTRSLLDSLDHLAQNAKAIPTEKLVKYLIYRLRNGYSPLFGLFEKGNLSDFRRLLKFLPIEVFKKCLLNLDRGDLCFEEKYQITPLEFLLCHHDFSTCREFLFEPGLENLLAIQNWIQLGSALPEPWQDEKHIFNGFHGLRSYVPLKHKMEEKEFEDLKKYLNFLNQLQKSMIDLNDTDNYISHIKEYINYSFKLNPKDIIFIIFNLEYRIKRLKEGEKQDNLSILKLEEFLTTIYKEQGRFILSDNSEISREKADTLIKENKIGSTPQDRLYFAEYILLSIGKAYRQSAPFLTESKENSLELKGQNTVNSLGRAVNCHWLYHKALDFLTEVLVNTHPNQEIYQSAETLFLTALGLDLNKENKEALFLYIKENVNQHPVSETNKSNPLSLDEGNENSEQEKLKIKEKSQIIESTVNEIYNRNLLLEQTEWFKFQVPTSRLKDQEQNSLNEIFQLKFAFEIAVGSNQITEANDLKNKILEKLKSHYDNFKDRYSNNDLEKINSTISMVATLSLSKDPVVNVNAQNLRELKPSTPPIESKAYECKQGTNFFKDVEEKSNPKEKLSHQQIVKTKNFETRKSLLNSFLHEKYEENKKEENGSLEFKAIETRIINKFKEIAGNGAYNWHKQGSCMGFGLFTFTPTLIKLMESTYYLEEFENMTREQLMSGTGKRSEQTRNFYELILEVSSFIRNNDWKFEGRNGNIYVPTSVEKAVTNLISDFESALQKTHSPTHNEPKFDR